MSYRDRNKWLTRAVLLGMTVGALQLTAIDSAEATTLTDYKSRLAAATALNVSYADYMASNAATIIDAGGILQTDTDSELLLRKGDKIVTGGMMLSGGEAHLYGTTTIKGDHNATSSLLVTVAPEVATALPGVTIPEMSLANATIAPSSAGTAVKVEAGKLSLTDVTTVSGIIRVSGLTAINSIQDSTASDITGTLNLSLAEGSNVYDAGLVAMAGGQLNISTEDYFDLDAKNDYLRLGMVENSTSYGGGVINLERGIFKSNDIRFIDDSSLNALTLGMAGYVVVNEDATLIRTTDFSLLSSPYYHNGNVTIMHEYNPLVLQGKLITTSSILFDNAAGSSTILPLALRTSADRTINFYQGAVVLTDDYYTATYAQAAKNLIDNADVYLGNRSYIKDGVQVTLAQSSLNNPALIMTGTLVDNSSGSYAATGSIAETALVNGLLYNGVTVNTGTNAYDTTTRGDNLYASKLNLTSSTLLAETLTIGETGTAPSNPYQLTLADTGSGELLLLDGVTPTTTVATTVGNSPTSGHRTTLRLADYSNLGNSATTLTSDVTVMGGHYNWSGTAWSHTASGGVLAIDGEVTVDGSVTVASTTHSVGGTGSAYSESTAGKLIIEDGASLTVNNGITLNTGARADILGTLTGTTLTATNAYINIGVNSSTDSAAGHVSLGSTSSLTGSRVFLDPAWEDSTEVASASSLAYASQNVDYLLTIGQNSIAALGTADITRAYKYFGLSRQTWGDDYTTASLYLDQPITLDNTNGGIKVDGDLTTTNVGTLGYATANNLYFDSKSLLTIEANALEAAVTAGTHTAAFTGVTLTNPVITVDTGADLYIANAHVGQTYNLLANFDNALNININGWDSGTGNLNDGNLFTSLLTKGTRAGSTVTITQVDAQEVMPNMVMPNNMNTMVGSSLNNADATNTIGYLSRIIEGEKSATHIADATRTLNIIANGAEVLGATAITLNNINSFAGDAQEHFSYLPNTTHTVEGKRNEVWAKYVHNRFEGADWQLMGMQTDFRNTFNGITAGVDLFSSKDKSTNLGLAFTYGEGKTTSTYGRNDTESFGVSLYGNYMKKNTNVLFDIGFGKTDHDVSGLVDSSPANSGFTMGIRGEYIVKQKNMNIIPHIGLRYTTVKGDSYTGYGPDNSLFYYNADRASTLIMPIGVGIHAEGKTRDGWKYNTLFDLSYIPALGGHDTDMTVRADGINAYDRITYDVIDKNTVQASLAFNMEKDNLSMGIGYSYQKGSSSENHRIQAGINIKF